ncbi:unnamed protein product [Pleuronectes platessa]|uniref:Uncharacterized protein n=1 Tax=Pleuronectes platessa TaxID=8262 RepID=A0A9N7Z9U5_PLEPL|nr:unnamed protein product [Pleuronectes platessa]
MNLLPKPPLDGFKPDLILSPRTSAPPHPPPIRASPPPQASASSGPSSFQTGFLFSHPCDHKTIWTSDPCQRRSAGEERLQEMVCVCDVVYLHPDTRGGGGAITGKLPASRLENTFPPVVPFGKQEQKHNTGNQQKDTRLKPSRPRLLVFLLQISRVSPGPFFSHNITAGLVLHSLPKPGENDPINPIMPPSPPSAPPLSTPAEFTSEVTDRPSVTEPRAAVSDKSSAVQRVWGLLAGSREEEGGNKEREK